VLDGVRVVWASLLEKPLEVFCRRPRRTLVVVLSGRDAPHAGAARHPVVTVVVAGHGRSPLKVLFAPLLAAFYALLGAVSGDVEWHLLIATQCLPPSSPCRAKNDRLIVGGALGGDVVRILKRALEEVVMSDLSQALCVMFGQRAHATLANLAANLWFTAQSLPLPWQGLG
jgi:hypothetical protein